MLLYYPFHLSLGRHCHTNYPRDLLAWNMFGNIVENIEIYKEDEISINIYIYIYMRYKVT